MSGSVALFPGVSLENSPPVDGEHTPLTASLCRQVGKGTWDRKGTSPNLASRLMLNPHSQCMRLLYSLQIWNLTGPTFAKSA